MPTGERTDPFRSFNFRVDVDGLTVGAFSEVSGLVSEGDSVDYRTGTDPLLSVRKLVGLRKYGTITLKRGYTANDELWSWYANIVNGLPDRRNGAITLIDEGGADVMRWSFENGWINKIEGPAMKATGNEVAMESVEIVHEALTFELA
jgi:phage tail-like protein